MIFMVSFSRSFERYYDYCERYKNELNLQNYFEGVTRFNQVNRDESWLNTMMAAYLAAKYNVEIIE